MSDIKFRTWDKEDKMMCLISDDVFVDGLGEMWQTACDKYNTPNYEIERTNRYELMQYTGLKDKNGKEIYEGDIVTFDDNLNDNEIFMVRWNALAGSWEMQSKEHHFLFVMRYIDLCKVIGNIYENPELLKGGVEND